MQKVLITGANSYIGTSFEKWMEQYTKEYQVETISVRGDSWKKKDFSEYDVVFHVAGIAHIKETKANRNLYYKVNRDLAYEVARKAKLEGVKHFIFLSSMSVYGLETGVIYYNSPLIANNAYGKSKIAAEKLIYELVDSKFLVSIIRPPMVYGRECTGNYSKLRKLVLKTPIFPDIKNRRSMIYIDNLNWFIYYLISNRKKGKFNVQNQEYICTSSLAKDIANNNNKNIYLSKLLGEIILKIVPKSRLLGKMFGDLIYSVTDSEQIGFESYQLSILKTEKKVE